MEDDLSCRYRVYFDSQPRQEKEKVKETQDEVPDGLPSFLSSGTPGATAESSTKRSRDDREEDASEAASLQAGIDDDDAEAGGAMKKQRNDDGRSQIKKMSKSEKKAKSGQNKGRKFANLKDEISLCSTVARGETCVNGKECRRSHDLEAYFKGKPRDIRLIGGLGELRSEDPFVVDLAPATVTEMDKKEEGDSTSDVEKTLDMTTSCPLFSIFGYCEHGWKCRFLGAHVRPLLSTDTSTSTPVGPASNRNIGGYELVTDEEKKAKVTASGEHTELNDLSGHWQKDIRKFPFEKTIPYLQEHDPESISKLPGQGMRVKENKQKVVPTPRPAFLTEDMDEEELANAGEASATGLAAHVPISHADPLVVEEEEEALNEKTEPELARLAGAEVDKDDVKTRPEEKRRLDWRGKTYLAPLTTVGNLVSPAW